MGTCNGSCEALLHKLLAQAILACSLEVSGVDLCGVLVCGSQGVTIGPTDHRICPALCMCLVSDEGFKQARYAGA